MCNISAGYFRINGSLLYAPNCNVQTNDTINVECLTTFPPSEVGKSYKAELKVKLSNGQDFSFYTEYRTVSSQETFISQAFMKPVPSGTYSTVWFVIYDINGNTVCSSDGKTGTVCKSITVSEIVPVPDNGILVNNQQTVTVFSGTSVKVNVRMSGGAGKQWRVIAISGSPLGLDDKRVSTGTLILDSNGYGYTNIKLITPGQYTLVGRWCNDWSDEAHCILYDSDTSRATINVEKPPPAPTGCPDCNLSLNFCILNNCIPKNYLFIAAAGFVGLMMLTRGD